MTRSWFEMAGSWFEIAGSWFEMTGSWFEMAGSWFEISWIRDPGPDLEKSIFLLKYFYKNCIFGWIVDSGSWAGPRKVNFPFKILL